jgi:hypothetical protein
MTETEKRNRLWESFIETLDIPESYYDKAVGRATSLENWFLRDGSSLAHLQPDVFPQGSFRYGTVIRPLLDNDEYDLDLVCSVRLRKGDVSQKQLKELVGGEVAAYAEAKQFKEGPEEKRRCWRLNYADHVSFHMDILPCVPESRLVVDALLDLRVDTSYVHHAVAITDTRHSHYERIVANWFSSNPRGFALWFERIAKQVAYRRIQNLVEGRKYASVDEVPPYEWKTPLQRVIQILKRHRDVMFRKNRDLAPISMIITTLAAHSYGGEQDLDIALSNIVARMPDFVRQQVPRVPNPVNPAEDFADRWATDSKYEDNFWIWHRQVSADVELLRNLVSHPNLLTEVRNRFNLELTDDQARRFGIDLPTNSLPKTFPTPSPLIIASAPKPWRRNA